MEATWYKRNGHFYLQPERVGVSLQEAQAVIAKFRTATAEIREDGNVYVMSADKEAMKVKMALAGENIGFTESISFTGIRINSRTLDVSQEQKDFDLADLKKAGA